jgi:hypothetical protein
MWEAVKPHTGIRRIDEVFPKEIRETTREAEMMIRFKNGSTWQLVGSDNYDSLVGTNPVGVIMSEFSIADPTAWEYIRPILTENGGWALFIYTPRGNNHGKLLFDAAIGDDEWFAQKLTAAETGVFPADFLAKELLEYQRENGDDEGRRLFEQEYQCSFAAAQRGAYYAEIIENARSTGRIGNVPWDAKSEVGTAWDLGIGDSTAIWFFQHVGQELRLIDYYENSGAALDHYVTVLRSKPYTYKNISAILPHDAEAKELGTGKSRQEVLRSLGVKSEIAPKLSVDDGINASRMLLKTCYIDSVRCSRGIECLENYRSDYDERRKILRPTPRHDWASHGADALRYLAVTVRPPSLAQDQARYAKRASSGGGALAAL